MNNDSANRVSNLPNHASAIRVVKLGGSLLDLPDLSSRVDDWISLQPAMRNILIVGGGKKVDQVRVRSSNKKISAEQAHWASIKTMDDNTKSIARLFFNWQTIDDIDAATSSQAANLLFSTGRWLQELVPQLPTNWDVTSDSIAAAIATHVHAHELVLLKSTDGPHARSIEAAIAARFLDRYFETVADEFFAACPDSIIRTVNFRSRKYRTTTF